MTVRDDRGADGWQVLANKIVVQAAKDYVKAKRTLLNSYDPEKRAHAERTLAECKEFFRSPYYGKLSDVDGVWLMKRLDEKVGKRK